jgi:cobalt/nickel transport protein|nr:energy-coupling factor ABC transporter substrate-binding protein [Geitlerinema sp. PCC 9228]
MMQTTNSGWKNLLLLSGVVALSVIPLVAVKDSQFGGADGKAEAAIAEVEPNYQPWFSPVITPPGGETESMLFALQAAVGSGILGFAIGLYKGRSQTRNQQNHHNQPTE